MKFTTQKWFHPKKEDSLTIGYIASVNKCTYDAKFSMFLFDLSLVDFFQSVIK